MVNPICNDGVQDTLCQNMALWNIEYLQEYEKQNLRNDRYKNSLTIPSSPLKQVLRPSCEVSFLYAEHYLQRQREAKRNLNKQTLLSFTSLLPLAIFICLTFSHNFRFFIKKQCKIKLNHLFMCSFPEAQMSHITLINQYAFLLLMFFVTEPQPRTQKGKRKKDFPALQQQRWNEEPRVTNLKMNRAWVIEREHSHMPIFILGR